MAQSEPLCVYCRRHPIDPAWRPFCSERCRLADLGRWLSEDYRAPAAENPDDQELPDTSPDSDSDTDD